MGWREVNLSPFFLPKWFAAWARQKLEEPIQTCFLSGGHYRDIETATGEATQPSNTPPINVCARVTACMCVCVCVCVQ